MPQKRIAKLFNYSIRVKDDIVEMKIILASKSPRRKYLLELLNLRFDVHGSDIEEHYPHDEPQDIVKYLASAKANDVAKNYEDALIIGADTIVTLNGEILEKPVDENHAFRMLKALSDNTHEVYTGVSIIEKKDDKLVESLFFEQTKVTFTALEDEEIRKYIATGSPMDKAGAYGIQDDWGAVFVKRIEGDYYNVVGFPLHLFYQHLKTIQPTLFA